MAVRRTPFDAWLEVDTSAKTVTVVFTLPAAEGEGDVEVLRQDVTSRLSNEDKRRLRHLLQS